MFSIVIPSHDTIRAIQQHENAFYWSAAGEAALRRHGIINVTTAPASQGVAPGALRIIARGQDVPCGPLPQIVEGPLSEATLTQYQLTATYAEAEQLILYDAEKKALNRLEYPACRVRKIPQKARTVSEPYAHVNDDARWNQRILRYQFFTDVPEGWKILFYVMREEKLCPVALQRGDQLVFSIPHLDIMAAGYAFAPLDAGYYDMISNSPATIVEAALVGAMREHAVANNIPVVEVEWWPHGKAAAFTVRHDMDRLIGDVIMCELLSFYAQHGVKASFGILQNRINDFQIGEIKTKGHELNLHSISRSLDQLGKERDALERKLGTKVVGFHSHGGGGSEGFLGDWHYSWGEKAGFEYLEMAGRSTNQPHHIVRVADNVPYVSHCTAPGMHTSLDTGMKPDAHRLEDLLTKAPHYVKQRAHFVLMNHPDIHLKQLYALIEALPLEHYWCATLAEVTQWFTATRGAKLEGKSVYFGRSLPQPCTIRLTQGAQIQEFTAESGAVEQVLA